MKSAVENKKFEHKKDKYFFCEHCLRESREAKRKDETIKEIYSPLVRLPLYIYPPVGKAVLVGYVDKCLQCQYTRGFVWEKAPDKYSSQRIKDLFIKENQGKYTRGLTEAEICSPKAFEINDEIDTDFFAYARRFNKLLDSYNGVSK